MGIAQSNQARVFADLRKAINHAKRKGAAIRWFAEMSGLSLSYVKKVYYDEVEFNAQSTTIDALDETVNRFWQNQSNREKTKEQEDG